MVAVQVRDVPEAVRKTLIEEARRRGTSLQAYLLDLLEAAATTVRNQSLAAEWRATPLVLPDTELDVVAVLHSGQDERSAALQETTTALRSP